MEDIFKPHSLTIKALFGNQDALYQIPRNQFPKAISNGTVTFMLPKQGYEITTFVHPVN